MIELPTDWYSLRLEPNNNDLTYYLPETSYSEKSILPSLWSVKFEDILSSDVENKSSMLYFNEGYDKDWGLYDNLLSLILGNPISRSMRCDGYANCFEIKILRKVANIIFLLAGKTKLFRMVFNNFRDDLLIKLLRKDSFKTE